MSEIDKIRKQIDNIDQKIMELLDTRYQLVDQIGQEKKKLDLKIYDSGREAAIYSQIKNFEYSHAIKNVYKTIIFESHNIQK